MNSTSIEQLKKRRDKLVERALATEKRYEDMAKKRTAKLYEEINIINTMLKAV